MTYGLKVVNEHNYIQIDSDTPRLCALESGRYQATDDRYARVTFKNAITTEEPPCIFIQNSQDQNEVLYDGAKVIGSAGYWTGFELSANNTQWRPKGKWFVAVFASAAKDSYGLRIWSSSAKVIFDSGATPVVVTRAGQDWSLSGYIQFPNLGGAYQYNNSMSAPLMPDEYFMINPFSRGLLTQFSYAAPTGVRYDWTTQRLQIYAVTNVSGAVYIDIGQPAAIFARLPGT